MKKLRKKSKYLEKLKKYPRLLKRKNNKKFHEELDFDYLDQLNDSELSFLSKFLNEYLTGNFDKDKSGNYDKSNFHKTKKARKTCTDRNNARYRDLYNNLRAYNQLIVSDDITEIMDNKYCYTLNEQEIDDNITAYFEDKKKVSTLKQKPPKKLE